MESPQVSTLEQGALQAQDGLVALHDLASAGDMEGRILEDIVHLMRRYNMWASNIGALHHVTDSMSLEHRLRKVPKLRHLFAGLLEDLESDLLEYRRQLESIFQQQKSTTSADTSCLLSYSYEPAILSKALHVTVTELFKASGVARRATKIDRFAKALSKSAPCDAQKELEYSRHLVQLSPRLSIADHDWLRDKLVKAHDARSRYLSVCQDHKQRTESGSIMPPEGEEHRGPELSADIRSSASTAGPGFTESTSLYSDTSSESSVSSYDTNTAQDSRYDVLRLDDLRDEEGSFICPYCQQEQVYSGADERQKRRWRRHVFADLRAYTCTDRSCGLRMFKTGNAWLNHQLSDHLLEWRCQRCHISYADQHSFKIHMMEKHDLLDDLEQWAKVSEIPMARIPASRCLFCPYTEKRISAIRRGDDDIDPLSIDTSLSPKKFCRHIGLHLEQIALGMLPVEYRRETPLEEDDGDSDKGLSEDNNEQNDDAESEMPRKLTGLQHASNPNPDPEVEDEPGRTRVHATDEVTLHEVTASRIQAIRDRGENTQVTPDKSVLSSVDPDQAASIPPSSNRGFTHHFGLDGESQGHTSSTRQWFIPKDGISEEVIFYQINWYLGSEATVRTGSSEGVQGYWINSWYNLTSAMIADLKAASSNLEMERNASTVPQMSHNSNTQQELEPEASAEPPASHASDSLRNFLTNLADEQSLVGSHSDGKTVSQTMSSAYW